MLRKEARSVAVQYPITSCDILLGMYPCKRIARFLLEVTVLAEMRELYEDPSLKAL